MYERPMPLGMASLRYCRNAASLLAGIMYQICTNTRSINVLVAPHT